MFVSWYRFYSGTAFTPAEISSCVGICHHNMEITLSDIIFSVLVLIPRSAFTLTPLLHAYKPSQAKDTKPIPNTKAQRPRTTHCLLVRGGRAPACEVYVGCCSLESRYPAPSPGSQPRPQEEVLRAGEPRITLEKKAPQPARVPG